MKREASMRTRRGNNRLEATKSFIKLMVDMAEHDAHSTGTREATGMSQLQLIPIKAAHFGRRLADRPRPMTWMFS
jgi:hypothetical protein